MLFAVFSYKHIVQKGDKCMAGLSSISQGRSRHSGQSKSVRSTSTAAGIGDVVGSMTFFYQQAAEKAGDPGARRMFLSLAAEEQGQMQDIGTLPPIAGAGAATIRQMIRSFEKSERALLRQIRRGTDEIEAMKIAMEMARESIRLYCTLLPKIQNPGQKEVVNRLLREEQERYTAIDNTCRFLAGSDNWFLWEEQSCADGGTPWS